MSPNQYTAGWTPEEDQIIRDNYPVVGYKGCMEFLDNNRTKNGIVYRAHLLGIHRDWKTNLILPFRLNKIEEQVIIGSLLGDGSILKPNSEKHNTRFSEGHSIKQKDYLLWKSSLLCRFDPRIEYYNNRGFGVGIESIRITTKSYPILLEKRKLWYPNGEKIIPTCEIEKIGPLGLAIWYMDDGTFAYNLKKHNYGRIMFATYCFHEEELQQLSNTLQERFNILFSVGKPPSSKVRGLGCELRLNRKNTDKFLELIVDYIHPSMEYKLPVGLRSEVR